MQWESNVAVHVYSALSIQLTIGLLLNWQWEFKVSVGLRSYELGNNELVSLLKQISGQWVFTVSLGLMA